MGNRCDASSRGPRVYAQLVARCAQPEGESRDSSTYDSERGIAWSRDSGDGSLWVATNRSVQLWDVRTMRISTSIRPLKDTSIRPFVAPGPPAVGLRSSVIASWSHLGTSIIDPRAPRNAITFAEYCRGCASILTSVPDASPYAMCTVHEYDVACLWDARRLAEPIDYERIGHAVCGVDVTCDGHRVHVAYSNTWGDIFVSALDFRGTRFRDLGVPRPFVEIGAFVDAIAFAPGDRVDRLCVASKQCVSVWNARTAKPVSTCKSKCNVSSIATSPEHSTVVWTPSRSSLSELHVAQMDNKGRLSAKRTFRPHDGGFGCFGGRNKIEYCSKRFATWSPSGRLLAQTDKSCDVTLWSVN